MEDSSRQVWEKARDVLIHRQPWLKLKPFMPRDVPEQVMESSWGTAWQSLRTGIKSWLTGNKAQPEFETLLRYTELPGAIPDIVDELTAAGYEGLAEKVAGHYDLYLEDEGTERQILFAPTYECNLNCSYCYAKGWNAHFNGGCSRDGLERLFVWLKDQDINLMVLAGGEPTVYKYFTELLHLAKKNDISVILTTNTLYPKSIVRIINRDYIREIVTHYNQDLITNPQKHHRFKQNFEGAKMRGLDIKFRYTLTDQRNADEWNFVLDLVSSLNIPVVNYACAFQNFKGNNTTFSYSFDPDDNTFEKKLLLFTKACDLRNLHLHLCKPVPLCAFSETTLRNFITNTIIRASCGAYLRKFSQNVTVNPDLSTFPCNAIASKGPLVTSFNTIDEAGLHNSAFLKQLLHLPYNDQCNNCLFFFRGFCQGSCLAEKYYMHNVKRQLNVL